MTRGWQSSLTRGSARAAIVLALCACTPLRGIRSSEATQSDAEVRDAQVNAADSATRTATTSGSREMCRGNAGAVLCDGAGVLYRCGDDGTIESSEPCASARHCQLGVADARCALCLPVEYRCDGDLLERCDPDGRGFGQVERCPSGMCDAQRGTCASSHNGSFGDGGFGDGSFGDSSFGDGSFGDGSCAAGQCVQCREDQDCSGASACQQDYCRASDNTCQRRPRSTGSPCGDDQVCDATGRCVECTADVHCGDNALCLANACQCQRGHVANASGKGCNFDECAQFDDNRCGTADGTGNRCHNDEQGYTCSCGAGWSSGDGQCFQSGTGQFVRNGASWDVFPQFNVVCDNAFDADRPCPEKGQLTMLNVCGLPDVDPNDCSAISGRTDGLRAAALARVNHTGPLETFGRPPSRTTDRIAQLQAGQVITVQTLSALVLLRIVAFDGEGMTYDWAAVWRDTCWRPGGLTCTAACNCPGGS